MKVRPGFSLVIALILLVGLVARYFYYRTDSSYWEAMQELKLVKHNETKPVYFDGELEPAFPDEDENNSTFFGVDSNKNGVRDDVEIWINRNFQTRNERMAYKQYQKAINTLYAEDKDRKNYQQAVDNAEKIAISEWNASSCVSYVEELLREKNNKREEFLEIAKMRNVGTLTFNSEARRYSHSDFARLSSRTSYEEKNGLKSYSKELGYKYCPFIIDNF